MFILIETDDTGYVETELIGTYNTYEDAKNAMTMCWASTDINGGWDHSVCEDFCASCTTEMEGGVRYYIFDSENN